jgi:sulfate transport system permease protein
MNTATVRKTVHQDPVAVRTGLIILVFAIFALLLFLPLILVFAEGFAKGLEVYLAALTEPDALAAIKLTLTTVFWVVPLNTLFGLAAAWALARFKFVGKPLLSTLIDLPFAVSPVIAGLIFVLALGSRSPLGPWLSEAGIKIIFSTPGIIIATTFITFPFVARELIPLMQSQGSEDEEAAISLGATGWQSFWLVTLPNIRWGLIYGVVLCNARAIGEFGAVSVVSGHIRGETNTIPLHVEILYNEYNFTASFAVSTLLVFIALLTIVAKTLVARHYKSQGARS